MLTGPCPGPCTPLGVAGEREELNRDCRLWEVGSAQAPGRDKAPTMETALNELVPPSGLGPPTLGWALSQTCRSLRFWEL